MPMIISTFTSEQLLELIHIRNIYNLGGGGPIMHRDDVGLQALTFICPVVRISNSSVSPYSTPLLHTVSGK